MLLLPFYSTTKTKKKEKKKYKETTKTFNLASYERFYDLYDTLYD